MAKSTALLLTKTPFGDLSGQDALDMAMILGTFEIPCALFFIGQSVTQFKSIKPETIRTKNFVKGYSALPFYDVDDLFICQQSLNKFNIEVSSLPGQLTVLDRLNLHNKLMSYDSVVKF